MKTKVEYSEKVTKVYDSYTYTDKEIADAVNEIMKTRREMGLPVTRNATSYISEWKSHNRLYKIGYQRSRTKDVDLEEEIDKMRDFLYSLFGL